MAPFMEHPSRLGSKRGLLAGVVVDSETVVAILKPLLDRTRMFGVLKPQVLACAPSDAKKEERQILIDSIFRSGAASLSVIPEPLAAAIGSGLDVSSPYAQMVVDIGEGVTDCAVIRAGRIAATCAIRTGCGRMRNAIVVAVRDSGRPALAEADGDALLFGCGLMRPPHHPANVMVAAALGPVAEEIADTVDAFLRDLPDDIGCEIIDSGICLTGGGALVPGIRGYLEQRTGIGVKTARAPLASVVEGARAIMPVVTALNEWTTF
ncbi:rod shape-determining protein [Geomonas sp. Red32]|uniref:rod shape-determining protein n=1 Tax=Geomonas sp. Red32 TaxID=2912856 RepID=UPI00202CBBC7|nr:rod shape-determining protein [Geomonas sp. Red32]MCM0080421.1 rod shape-determining protein [Geomonas sp. Red32]